MCVCVYLCAHHLNPNVLASLLQDNDAEAEAIAKDGQQVARELLKPHRLYCYYYLVLQVNGLVL